MVTETDNANKSKDPSSKNVSKNECLGCDKLRRKVKENEHTVSARDVLIEMSQKEIQKLQTLYKNSIDDYETLRFTYCSIVQEYSNLKDIHKKLEEEQKKSLVEKRNSLKKTDLETLQSELDHWKNQYEKLQKHKRTCTCGSKDRCSDRKTQVDLLNIQSILQYQNQSVKLLLSKFLEELKETKVEQNTDKSCQTGSAVIETSEENLKKQIDNLNSLVDKLTIENTKIKENLNEKQTHLFKCLNVLEKNHSDIGNLSGHIENICNERDKCTHAIDEKDKEIFRLKCELNEFKKTTEDIEELRLEKERYFQENKKLRHVIDTFRIDTEEKERIINEVHEEKTNLHEELGQLRRMTENLQKEIGEKAQPDLVERLKREIKMLKTENEGYVEELEKINSDRKDKELLIEGLNETIEYHEEMIKKLRYEIDMLVNDSKETEEALQNTDDESDELEELETKYKQLQDELLLEVEKHNEVVNDLQNTIDELKENVNDLGDTLTIITEENKSNLKTIEELRKQLKETQEIQEKGECGAKCEIKNLKNEVEDLKNQLNNFKSRQKTEEIEQNIDYHQSSDKETVDLQEKITSLEKDLENANLEIIEYEEENKACKQKLESLMKEITYLQEEKLRVVDESCVGLNKLKEEYSKTLSEKEDRIVELQEEISKLVNESGDHLGDNSKISKLESDLQVIEQEKSRLELEKTDLIGKIVKLESELEKTLEETGDKILTLEHKLSCLEKHDEEIKNKLMCCCEEMSKMEATLKENKESQDCNIEDLEKQCMMKDSDIVKLKNTNDEQTQEIEDLKSVLNSYQKRLEVCDCGYDESMDLKKDNEELRTKLTEFDDMKKLNEELTSKVGDLEDELCRKECMIMSLEKCIDKSNRILGDCENEIKRINAENLTLKDDLEVMKANLEKLNCEIDVHKADKDILQEKVHQSRRQSEQLETENSKLLKKTGEDQKIIEDKISVLQQKYNKLLEESEGKDMELDKLKKQFELLQSCCKSPSITKEEFQKMKKVSKEIKDLLMEQAKKINENTVKTAEKADEEESASFVKKYVSELEEKINKKEDDLKCLESKNNNMTAEILDLKQNIHKLMLDNIDLKKDITNLLNTVIHKVRLITTSGENIDSEKLEDSAATGVLNSLLELEKGMLEDTKPNACPISSCNCMSVISAKYSFEGKDDPLMKTTKCLGPCAENTNSCVVLESLSESKQDIIDPSKKITISADFFVKENVDLKPSNEYTFEASKSIYGCMQAITNAFATHSGERESEPKKELNTTKQGSVTSSSPKSFPKCEAKCSGVMKNDSSDENNTKK